MGSTLLHIGRRVGPVLISFGLVIWLVWSVTPEKLYVAFSSSAWPWLVLATLVQLLMLFTWDTVCVWWLFRQPNRALPFRRFLRARTDTVIWSAINLEVGQGVFAFKLAKLLDQSVTESLGRFLLLALFDFGTLQSLALFGSIVRPDPLLHVLRWIPIVSLTGLALLMLLLRFMPSRWRNWLAAKPWAQWLNWWSWRQGVVLYGLRLILFVLVIVYAWVGLAICRLPVNARVVFGVIPFVMLAESLPGTGGLGERETALVYLLHVSDEQRAVVLSFGLIWSVVIILGRIMIGLVSSWLPAPD